MKFPIIALAGLSCVGCVSPSSVTPERCGPPPSMAQAEWGVGYAVQRFNLKDPSSAQVRNIRVSGMFGQANIHGNVYGWRVDFDLNAKNSFGGYVGFQPRFVIMLNGGNRVWFNPIQIDLR